MTQSLGYMLKQVYPKHVAKQLAGFEAPRCSYLAPAFAKRPDVKAFGPCHAAALLADAERRNPGIRAFYGLPPGDSPLPTEDDDYGLNADGTPHYPARAFRDEAP